MNKTQTIEFGNWLVTVSSETNSSFHLSRADGQQIDESELKLAEEVGAAAFALAGQSINQVVKDVGGLLHPMCRVSDLAGLYVILGIVGAMMTKVAQIGKIGGQDPMDYVGAGTALAADIILKHK